MKNKILISSLAFSLVLASCNERVADEIPTNKLQKESVMSHSMKKGSVSFTFRLGRVSKNCAGLGICELSALGVTIV